MWERESFIMIIHLTNKYVDISHIKSECYNDILHSHDIEVRITECTYIKVWMIEALRFDSTENYKTI